MVEFFVSPTLPQGDDIMVFRIQQTLINLAFF